MDANVCSTCGFWADGEQMDLSDLYDLQFAVSISTGHRDDAMYLCKCLRGPFDFDSMVGEVSRMLNEDGNNSKVIIMNNDPKSKLKWLDAKTTEFIQFRAVDIIFNRMFLDEKEYTCKASIMEDIGEAPKKEEV